MSCYHTKIQCDTFSISFCLSVPEISLFSMVSRQINRYVVDYISTQAYMNKVIIHDFHHPSSLEHTLAVAHYTNLGKCHFSLCIFRDDVLCLTFHNTLYQI